MKVLFSMNWSHVDLNGEFKYVQHQFEASHPFEVDVIPTEGSTVLGGLLPPYSHAVVGEIQYVLPHITVFAADESGETGIEAVARINLRRKPGGGEQDPHPENFNGKVGDLPSALEAAGWKVAEDITKRKMATRKPHYPMP